MKKLTYFTPTFNRANLLKNLYDSLKNQSNKDFVWLIIDDGSDDETMQVVNNFQKENIIEINYIFKENGGKHTAMELAHQKCKTEYICCVDSDDWLDKDATINILNALPNCVDKNVVGIVAPKINILSPKIANSWETFNKKNVMFYDFVLNLGKNIETTLIFKTEIIKNYHFPIFNDERFVTESVFYKQFLFDYKLFVLNKNLYYFKYLPDGYTAMGINLMLNNPKGFLIALSQNAECAIKYKRPLKYKIYYTANYFSWRKILKNVNIKTNPTIPFLYRILGSLACVIVHTKNKLKYNNFKKSKR